MKKTGLRDYEYEKFRAGDEKTSKQKVIKEILDWVKTIAIGVIVGVLLVVFVIQRDNVYGDSMNPTLYTGDVVFTQKICTYFHSYHRGDIVILDGDNMIGYDKEEYLIKRIIGLPGEHIRIADGKVYIMEVGSTEFIELDEPYLAYGMETTVRAYGVEQGYDDIILGDDEYFCMGDNRIVSNDSRTLGPFTVDRIKGIAFVVVYPLSEVQFL
ncbi:MAG: signal peptidase I [Clostridiales bacterium]|nr:signal peptidase I [Clostridiales bacterium]